MLIQKNIACQYFQLLKKRKNIVITLKKVKLMISLNFDTNFSCKLEIITCLSNSRE